MANFSIYLPDELKKKLDKKAEESGESRNKIIRSAVGAYLEESGLLPPTKTITFKGVEEPIRVQFKGESDTLDEAIVHDDSEKEKE